MAFVNEYVSDADVEKYELDSLRKRLKGDVPPGFRHTWTIDRERNSYYIPLWIGGGKEPLNQVRGILYHEGVHWDVAVRHELGGSVVLTDEPYRIKWGLVHIEHPSGNPVPREQIVPVLKEALAAYGVQGVHFQVPNTVVTFAF